VRLLRHLTAAALEGRGADLKEYSLGIAVFERPPSFDPRIDSVVRLEARRLRLKLAEYYQQEGAEDPVAIELPKGAYVPEFRVRHVGGDSVTPAESARSGSRLRFAVLAAVMPLLIALAIVYPFRKGPHAAAARRSVAVLAFRNHSARQELDYLADGLSDGLMSALVHTPGLEVTARASSRQKHGIEDEVEAARSLPADTAISGSVTPSGNDVQVVISLVDLRSGKFLWSGTYKTAPAAAELPVIERSAASGIAGALGVSRTIPVPGLPRNAAAAELYLRACSLARTRAAVSMREAAGLFERGIALDPEFAPLYAAAASNYLVGAQNSVMPWREVGARGMDLARKALDLDPTLADAHSAMACGFAAQWKWRESEAELAQAIDLDPRSPIAHFRRGYTLAILRRFREAEAEAETARTLDPAWGAAHGLLGELYFYERRYEDTLAFSRQFRDSDPRFFDGLTARVYVAQGKWDLARPLLLTGATPFEQDLGRAISGDVDGAYRDLLRRRGPDFVSAYHVACFTLLQLHDRQKTLEWLERSLREHDPDLVSFGLDPMFDDLRSDRRAAAILRELNLI
jgi:adenylate cyclase